jgi:ABC-type polysaccharide/polyol phosphate export permease
MRFRTILAGPLIQTPVFLILFLTPVFVPLSLLQGWVEAVAHINPATLILEAVRGLIAADPFHTGAAYAVALALVALSAVFAVRGRRSAERNA